MSICSIGSNQTELRLDGKTILISYKTPVAANIEGKFYRTAKKWSATTSRHINKWLNGAAAEEKTQEFFDSLL